MTPGISATEYHLRRERLAGALPSNSIAILSASDIKYRSNSVFYAYHQDADFFYLTGFNEPEALAVIQKPGSGPDYVFHLFVRPKDAKAELWEGARSGVQAAQDVFNADEPGDILHMNERLGSLIANAKHIYTDIPTSLPNTGTSFEGKYLNGLAHWRHRGLPELLKTNAKSHVQPLRRAMNELRVRKSEAEIANMLRAGRASSLAFNGAIQTPMRTERELAAYLDYHFITHGCDGTAYVPVVASGRNALSIHYVRNDDVLRHDEFVLVDAGGEYGGYVTDITRTFPQTIDGTRRFSTAQRDLYEAVLEPQKRVLALCRANSGLSLDDLHTEAERGLRDNLRSLGFDMSARSGGDAMSILFPHHVGHHIGLDVHDAPGFSRRTKLEVGMCITVEPGLYVPDDIRWPAAFRGMGIRIEDSVCVQSEAPLVLSAEAIKEVKDIEDAVRNPLEGATLHNVSASLFP